MAIECEFVMSDESINSYGSRVITSGIDLTNFKKNPVAFYNHDRWKLPIGRWEDVKVDGDKLVGKLVLVKGDEEVDKLGLRLEQGVLNAVSIGFRIIELSDDAGLVKKGQTMMTVTKCQLTECSLVDVPANKNAVKLYDVDGELIGLSDDGALPEYMKLHTQEEQSNNNNKDMEMKQIGSLLGMSDANEQNVTEKITQLQEKAKRVDTLEAEVKELKEKAEQARVAAVDALLKEYRAAGVVTDENEQSFKTLALSDFESTQGVLKGLQAKAPKTTYSDGLAGFAERQAGEAVKESYDDLAENNPEKLAQLKANDFDGEYSRIFMEKFGKAPTQRP